MAPGRRGPATVRTDGQQYCWRLAGGAPGAHSRLALRHDQRHRCTTTTGGTRRQRIADPAVCHIHRCDDQAHPDPGDHVEPLLAWFNAAMNEHKHDIAVTTEGLGDAAWGLPASRRWAARRLVRMWERDGVAAFSDLAASLTHKPLAG
jgi:hypothetical protein